MLKDLSSGGLPHPLTAAFVTPSFPLDLARCELLVESRERLASDFTHYLLIDEPHIPVFKHLESDTTKIVPSRDLLGQYLRRIPGSSGYWIGLFTPPVRGWMTQQLRKLAICNHISEDIVICIDSDTAFVRPFRIDDVIEEEKIGLLDVPYRDASTDKWTRVSETLLGLPKDSVPVRNHVAHLVPWVRNHVIDMLHHVEKTQNKPWQIVLARQLTFSEYTLYGAYIRGRLGYENSMHVPSSLPLVRQPWSHDFGSSESMRAYICFPEPGNVAVMIHSKFGISADDLRPHFREIWNSNSS